MAWLYLLLTHMDSFYPYVQSLDVFIKCRCCYSSSHIAFVYLIVPIVVTRHKCSLVNDLNYTFFLYNSMIQSMANEWYFLLIRIEVSIYLCQSYLFSHRATAAFIFQFLYCMSYHKQMSKPLTQSNPIKMWHWSDWKMN